MTAPTAEQRKTGESWVRDDKRPGCEGKHSCTVLRYGVPLVPLGELLRTGRSARLN